MSSGKRKDFTKPSELPESRPPTDEELADYADRMDDWAGRNLDEVANEVLRHFCGRCPLDYTWIVPQGDAEFRAFIFFDKDKDVAQSKRSGLDQQIIDYVYDSLERWGRGSRGEIKVVFEFDSRENVEANFEGSYWERVR